MEFEVGKWYKSNIKKMSSKLPYYYIKVEIVVDIDTIVGFVIESDGKIIENKKWDDKDSLNGAILMNNLSEIRDLLPDGHIDKIKPIIIKQNYKYLLKILNKYGIK
jgi:hypothetical protein